ncbi:MAG: CARDB domain-containing protein [Candidatus Thermoplasmatota archaeon]|nr:CARDB domain-containing protein [Candidatus Thermoplasmatota archaeon]
MGDHSRIVPSSLVLLMILSILVPLSQPTNTPELESESSLNLVSTKSGSLIDVTDWRIGDEWIYDAEFDVEDLVVGGAPGSQVGVLTGLLSREVVDIRTATIDNVSTIVYDLESSGTFNYNGATIVASGFSVGGDLEVELEMEEVIRASDLSQITYNMDLDVDFNNIGFPASLVVGSSLDLATMSIDTDYSPPKEIYDFPINVGEIWDAETTTSTSWSGEVYDNLFELPEDSSDSTTERFEIVGSGDPGVAYSGCSNAYNVTAYNASTGNINGYRWWCDNAQNDAWWHQSIDVGANVDFRLNQYNPVSRTHEIDVELAFPAWPLDVDLGVWVNVTNSNGQPVANQDVEFRYEIEEDIRTVTTAANGSAYLMFDTGHELDASPTTFDYASHGVIAWIPSTNEIGVTTLTLDENLVEIDLAAVSAGVSVTRLRDDVSQQLNSLTGYYAIPGDELTFSVPVQNRGILSSPATILEIQAPDGSSSQVSVPSLPALGVFTADISWTVPQSQSVGDVQVLFTVDPAQAMTQDANRSNNQGTFTLFVGRLPTADFVNMDSKLTFEDITIDASLSTDPDGGSIYCLFEIELENGTFESFVESDCIVEKLWEDDGEYVVNLTVVDDENDATRSSLLVVVENRPAVVNLASSATSVMVGQSVTFNAYDHSDIDTVTPQAPIDMLWLPPDAPNGEPYGCSQGTPVTQVCSVTPEVEGVFTMSFRAIDDDFDVTTVSHSITVTNIAPYNASIQLRDAATGELATMNAQGIWVVDEDQEIELLGFVEDSPNDLPTMRWEWQPDSQSDPSWFETTQGPNSVVPVSWSTKDAHVIVMQVFDDDDETTGTISAYVMVLNVEPTIEPFEEPLPLWEDAPVMYTAEFSDSSSDLDSLVACWDLNPFINLDQEGSSDDDCDITGPSINDHSWSDAGIYPAIFHVTDDDGSRTSQIVNFTVRNRQPVADIWVSTIGPKAGEMFGLSGNLSTDTATDQPNLVYRWDLDTSVDSDGDTDPTNDIDEIGMEIWVSFDEPGERGIRLMVSDEIDTSTMDYTIVVMESEGGFSSFFGGGGLVSTIVIILGIVLAGLLGILAWTSIREREQADPWDQVGSMELEAEQEAPMAAPPSDMFGAAPPAQPAVAAPEPQPVASAGPPPIPAEGLPPGWSVEQWNHYGAQWLSQQATAEPVPVSEPVVENPNPLPTFAEDDLDLDF